MDESSRRPRQVDGDGAAKRRRLHRLRSWWRHEQQTVQRSWQRFSTTAPHEDRGRPGLGGSARTNHTATLRKMLPPRDGFCGTLWDICPRLLLMFLCHRWWTSCRTLSNSFLHSHLILSRLSKCPRSCLSMSLCARPCALRSWWNSWWKYRRPYLTLPLQRTVEQHVDIPVPGGGGPSSGLHVFFPGQRSTSSPTRTHGRRRLSWRTPSSGCGSKMTSLASRTTGTDALVRLSGSHRLASRWCGTPQRMRRGPATSGTRKRVSPRFDLLFLLGEELHRQPRAVYKYWAPYCAFSSAPRFWQSFIRCSLWFDSGYILRQSTAACGRCSFLDKVCSLFVVQRQVPGCPDIPVVRRGSSPWSSSYHSTGNQFERFRGFLELISRFEFDVLRRENFFLNDSNFWCVHVNVPWPVCAHAIPFRMLWRP